jgi:hypothetical protein
MSIARNLNLIPQNQLIQYVKNPQLAAAANIPAASALFELQRRTEQEKELANLKAQMATMQAPQTIAAKTIQEAKAPGIAAIPTKASMAPTQGVSQLAQTDTEMPTENMAEGGVASLDTGDMYNEKHYAGGGIVAFEQGGGVNDPYEIVKPGLIPRRKLPTYDDLLMEQAEAEEKFNVQPDYFGKRIKESEAMNKEELDSAKRMSNANILFAMAEKLGSTPGSILRGLTAAGPAGGKAAIEGMQNEAKIKQLQRLAQDKLKDAQYAQARGDAQAAQKHIEDYRNINTNIDIEQAKLTNATNIANAKNAVAGAGNKAKVNASVYGSALKDFANAFPNGAQETVFHGDPGFFQYVKNNYITNAQDFIANNKMPVIPTATQLEDMYSTYKKGVAKPAGDAKANVKPASDVPAIKRPDYIQSIMNKYSDANQAVSNQQGNIRNKNTQAELDTPWDLAGQGLEDQE